MPDPSSIQPLDHLQPGQQQMLRDATAALSHPYPRCFSQLLTANDSGTPGTTRSIRVIPAGPAGVISGPIVQEFV